jgi:L-threonylcarbamoyladenylate synthase
VSGPDVVSPRRREEALAAIGAGRVIAVPGDGGYRLAAGCGHRDANVLLAALGGRAPDDTPVLVMVGRHEQAIELAATWSNETRIVTDRMWPGPLTIIVPSRPDACALPPNPLVHITMPGSRSLRLLCRDAGPLVTVALRRSDGHPIITADDVKARYSDEDVALIIDGGTCSGPGPTVVDCTASPPTVRVAGALPESFVDAALMMSRRRRRWFATRRDVRSGSS